MTNAREAEQEKRNKTPLLKKHNQLYNGKSHNNPKLTAARYHLASDRFDIYAIQVFKATSIWTKLHCL